MAAAAQAPLDRATLLERRQSTGSAAGRRQRAASLDRTSKLLEQEQADLERAMQSKAGSTAATPHTDDGRKGKFSWPSMPGIKPQLGGKRDSLQPIGRSRSPRHSVASPVVPSSAASPTGVLTAAPFGASKLPAIGKVPDIKINTSHRPRRDPNDETRAAPAPGSLTEPRGEATRAGSPKASMVNFEGLERPVSGERGESLSDYEEALGDVPTNTLDDLPSSVFDDIPTSVFDAIPTAVEERQRKRTLLRSKAAASKAAAKNAAGKGGTNSRDSIQYTHENLH